MNTSDAIDQRLTDLEIKASFTEDLVEQLNQTIYQQQQQIEALIREVHQLRQQVPDGGTGGFRSLRDELPPHY
jgi:SlyX protein